MVDLKDLYQGKAEELALEEHNSEFYDLPDDVQQALYSRAVELVWDDLASRADSWRKERKERCQK